MSSPVPLHVQQGVVQQGMVQPGPGPHGPAQQGALPQATVPLPPLCHVTVVAPRKKADLALPSDIPLPHVMPGLLRAVGEVGGEAAAAPGWVLQRLGGPPLDLGQSLGALGVLDGEVLYLRPRDAVMPPAVFDDVADVVATGTKEGGGRWEPRHTRLLGMGVAAALLALGAVVLALAAAPPRLTAGVAGAVAVLLVAAGAVVSRAVGQPTAGALVGYAALPHAFLAGLFTPGASGAVLILGAPNLLAGLAYTALVATVGGVLIADGVAGFLGVAVASVAGAVGAACVMVFGGPGAGAAAVVATALLALSPLIPTLSFRMARVPLPPLPTSAEELRSDNQRIDGPLVLQRTAQAHRYATGMVIAIALAGVAAELLLVRHGGWVADTTAATLALALAMRARVFAGVAQRLWMVLTAVAGAATLAFAVGTGADAVGEVAVTIGVLWTALLALGLGLWLPAGRPSPFWGRAADILDALLIVALVPFTLGVLDLYSWVRGLSG
ncbi:type VII secretion integral membrane protein EccD [Microbispora hainanensis]|uniref:type VII secretion integral membrane protein EccD n=1 Tax=Microbispora hainanensis TaxID=568844 RepID=UPI00324A4C24